MRYMLLIYNKEDEIARTSQEEKKQLASGHWAVMDETRRLGILQGAEPLSPTNTATSVRQQDGKTLITDGPFAETKEQLGGYYILDCKDLDEAIAWAAKLSTACGTTQGVEIRRLPGLPPRDDEPVAA
jgi:hypothetical protein